MIYRTMICTLPEPAAPTPTVHNGLHQHLLGLVLTDLRMLQSLNDRLLPLFQLFKHDFRLTYLFGLYFHLSLQLALALVLTLQFKALQGFFVPQFLVLHSVVFSPLLRQY
jgi:hypothetical protein